MPYRFLLFLFALLPLLASCAVTPAYYWQAASGQFEIMRLARPIAALRADPATPEALRARLALADQLHAYAVGELALPEKGFRSYADLQRNAVVWNVFATDPLSLRPREWCVPVAGCIAYLGYFSQVDAQAHAARLAAEGLDTWVGAVPAYSTLGWFEDPVLNTWINWPDYEVARLIFHELAHQIVYVQDDSAFNESFAAAVEEAGVRRWLASSGQAALVPAFERSQQTRAGFAQLIDGARRKLEAIYASADSDADKRAAKAATLAQLKADYARLRDTQWGGWRGYDRWFERPLNNASLASVGLYSQWASAFTTLLAQQGGNLPQFYRAVRQLAGEPAAVRREALATLAAPALLGTR